MQFIRNILRQLYAFASTPRFIWVVTGLLVVQAVWIAASGRYPMAFDEDFHMGIINLYAHHLNPFWSAHPAGADAYGAVARDPSYLYHYLMSFPMRILSVFTDNMSIQVLALRMLNIIFFASGLLLFQRLLKKIGGSDLVVNMVLLLFVLVPIVPLLAAQVNYDNVIFPLTAASLYLAILLTESLKKKSINVEGLLLLLVIGLSSSLVKYAFLPIFTAIVFFVAIRLWQSQRTFAQLRKAFLVGWRKARPMYLGLLIVGVLFVSALFVERYGVNLARYHTPVPDCAQVLLYDQCQHYGPWIRDYNFAQTKPSDAERSPVSYTQHWLYGMWFRSFFAVDGPGTGFQTRGPLTLPGVAAVVLIVLGATAFVLAAPRVWRRYNTSALWLVSSCVVLYVGILWLTEYQLFLQTGQPVAINGRYLIPLLPVIMLVMALSLYEILPWRRWTLPTITALALLCFAWGGGALTYVLRSNDAWYWQYTPLKAANHALQRTMGPITPGNEKPTQYLH